MRLTTGSALLLLALAFAPQAAQAGGMVVSGFNCPQLFPCDQTSPGFPSPDQLMSLGNNCAMQHISLNPGANLFDAMSGVDSDGCLATNMDALSTKGKTVPQCCIKPFQEGKCVLHCDLVGQ